MNANRMQLSVLTCVVTFVLAGLIGVVAATLLRPVVVAQAPLVVVCEQGTFEPVATTAADPYLRERATCNLTDANGAPVTVLIID